MRNLKFKRHSFSEVFEKSTLEKDTIHLVPVSLDPIIVKAYDVDSFGNVAELSFDGWEENKEFIINNIEAFQEAVTEKVQGSEDIINSIEKVVPRLYTNKDAVSDLVKLIDFNTGVDANFKEVTKWVDGTDMTDAKVDGVMYLKIEEKYFARQFENYVNVKWFGAEGKGGNDTAAIQAGVDFCNLTGNTLFFPEGLYLTNATISFNKARPVSNSEKYGMTIAGQGKSTIIKHFGAGNILFDMYSTGDIQVNIRDITLMDGTYRTNFAIRLGILMRYSVFSNVSILGFKQGIAFHQPIYRMSFNDVYIRGCERSIMVDADILGQNVLTELSFNRCYFDNNGMGFDTPHFVLYNVQETKFNDCIFEGNFSFGLQIKGASENIIFQSCRFEETEVNTTLNSGHINEISPTSRNIVFSMCEIAYKQNGVDGSKNYSLFYIGKEVVFENCQFIDTGNANPTNVFGATPETSVVKVVGGYTGIGNDFKVNIPKRYMHSQIGPNSFIWENNGVLLKKINGFPANDSDGVEL